MSQQRTPRRSDNRFDNRIGRDNNGTINQAARDVNTYNVQNRFAYEEPMDELFQGRGAGRALLWLGILVSLAGFAGWMLIIFSAMGVSDPTAATAFETKLLGLPTPAVAFGAFAGGGVLASLGAGMSRASRARGR